MGDQKIEIAPEKKPTIDEVIFRLDEKIRTAETPVERQKRIRAELQSLTRSELELLHAKLKKGSDVLAVSRSPEQSRVVHESIDQEVRSRLPQVREEGQEGEVWNKPDSWSPQTKQRMEAVGWGVGIGVTVVGLALLWRATKKKVTETARATEEKAGWLWGKLKWVLGLGAAGVLGYVGIRAFQEFNKLTAMKNQLDAAMKKAETLTGKAKEAAEKEIADLKTAIATLEGKGKQALENQKNNIQTKKEEMKEKTKTTVKAIQEKGKQIAENPHLQEAEKNMEEVIFAKGMLLFSPAEDSWTASEGTKATQLTDIINLNSAIPIADILDARSQPFKIEGEDLPNRQQAAAYLWSFCKKNHQAAGVNPEKTITLQLFLRKIAETYSAALPIDEILRSTQGNLLTAAGKFDAKEILMKSKGLKKELRNYIEKNMEDAGLTHDEMENLDWTELVEIFSSIGGSIGGGELERIDSPTGKVLRRISEKMKNPEKTDVHKYMLPFFHRVLPKAAWDPKDMKKNRDQIHSYLTQRMPAHQALRFGFYVHLMKKGNPVGVVLMQAEVLKYIADEGKDFFLSINKNIAAVRMMEALAGMTKNKLSEEFQELNIDESMIDKGFAVLTVAAKEGIKLGAAATTGVAIETGLTATAIGLEHPTETIVTTVVGMEVLRRFIRAGSPTGDHMIKALETFKSKYETQWWYRNWTLAVRGIPEAEIDKALTGYTKLYQEISELAEGPAKLRLLRQLEDCSKAISYKPAWNTMISYAQSQKLGNITTLIEPFVNSVGMQRAVAAQRYWPTQLPLINGVLKSFDFVSGTFWRNMSDLYNDESSGMRASSKVPEVVEKTTDAISPASTRTIDASIKTADGKVVEMEFKPNAGPNTEAVGVGAVKDKPTVSRTANTEAAIAETSGQLAEANTRTATKTGEALADAAKTAAQGSAAAEALTKPAEVLSEFDSVYAKIREARAAKDNRKVLELLRRSAELIKTEAAAGNRTARAMLLVLRFATAAKWAGRVLLILGPLVDAALLIVNRIDISAAQEAKNEEMVHTLESKEKVLAGQAGVGLSMFLMSGPQALLVAPVAITSSVIANNIYDSIIRWEKSSRQWLNENPETLKKKYEELEFGYMDAGHKYGILTHPFARPFTNWGKTSAQVDSEEYRQVESVNQHVRQEILTAYFLKTMRLPAVANETQEQYKQRAVVAVQDRLAFVKATTDGSYARGILSDERFFGQAEDYANLVSMQRTLDAHGQKRVLSYEWNGTIEQLDLGTLDYIRSPRSGNTSKDDQRQMALLKTMYKYREQVLVYSDAVREMQTMAPSVAGK